MTSEELRKLPLGHELEAGPLLGGLSATESIKLRLVETGRSLTFAATYMGIRLGEVKYSAGRWSKNWT